jgi:hypothetical protein
MFSVVAPKVTKYITDSCRQCGSFPQWMLKGASGLKSDTKHIAQIYLRSTAFFRTRTEVSEASRLTLLSPRASLEQAGTACLLVSKASRLTLLSLQAPRSKAGTACLQ